MLTRIEIDGFKTFRGFELDLGPFNVIAGTNASGKSNLFDVIQLLSRLAEGDLRAAVTSVRGQPAELFHRRPDGSVVDSITLACEVLLAPSVKDPWGAVEELTHTRVRYEVTLERRVDENGFERFFVGHEAAVPLRAAADDWATPYRKPRTPFSDAYLRYSRQAPFLQTVEEQSGASFKIGQDGHQGRLRPAFAAEATVLSSMTTAEFKHLFALREEMRSWRFLQLDPSGLRSPADQHAPSRLEPSGWNLAAVLARIKAETATQSEPQGLLTDLSADLARLIPGIARVDVRDDRDDHSWQTLLTTRAGARYTGRVASDGTLRLLALLTALTDPTYGGLFCFEEPENGVHPGRIRPLVEHLRDLVLSQIDEPIPTHEPLLQLILSTHSPVVVGVMNPGEGVFFDSVTRVSESAEEVESVTRSRPVHREIQTAIDPDFVGQVVTQGEVRKYLDTVEAA